MSNRSRFRLRFLHPCPFAVAKTVDIPVVVFYERKPDD